jgi:hypothetical protein
MVEVRSDENGHAKIYEVNEINLRGRLDRAAKWVRWKNMREAPTPPPIYVVQDMLNDPKPLPMIKGVTHVPIFSPDGVLETKSGYLPRSKMFYAPTQTQIPEVSKKPSNQEIKEALYLLNQELLIDFPFRDQSSKTHALSMIFLPFCRQMIHGPTPLNLIDGSRRGVGKSLLARITYLIAMGSDAAMVKLPKTEENLRSRLFLS